MSYYRSKEVELIANGLYDFSSALGFDYQSVFFCCSEFLSILLIVLAV